MPGAFEKLGRAVQRRKLERELARQPTPQKAAELIRDYLSTGETERALDIARKGVAEFPDSAELPELLSRTEHLWQRERIAELRSATESSARKATDFAELADLLQRSGNASAALHVCMDGLTAFPSSPELHISLGRMRLERFHYDLLAKDGIAGIGALQTALELEPSSGEAMLLLGQTFLEIGCTQKARELTDKLSRLYLRDERVLKLQQALEQAAGELDDPNAACKAVARDRRFVIDLWTTRRKERAETVEQPATLESVKGRLEQVATFPGFTAALVLAKGGEVAATRHNVTGGMMKEVLAELNKEVGVRGSAIVTRDGIVVAADVGGGLKEEAVAAMASSIILATEKAAQDVGLGSLRQFILTSAYGKMVFVDLERAFLVVVADMTIDLDMTLLEIAGVAHRLKNLLTLTR